MVDPALEAELGNGQAILDRFDSRCGPCGGFHRISFIPGADLPLENYLVIVADGHANCPRFDLGVSLEGLLDLVLDLRSLEARFDFDIVAHAPHAGKLPNVILGVLFVRRLLVGWTTDLDLVRDGPHTSDPTDSRDGSVLLGIAGNVPSESHDSRLSHD